MAYTRHSLATRPDSAELPSELDQELRDVLSRYDFHEHARPGNSPNARLAASVSPALAEHLERRYAVIGTPEAAAEQLIEIAEETGIRRFWLACNVEHPERVLRLAERMTARLALRDAPTAGARVVTQRQGGSIGSGDGD
jgi:alkanesulfonate monooxygenase SsuD/methylene tetrahydromethanopterin reductase-like flavin-dependent oxidoreductase (luciferase family)